MRDTVPTPLATFPVRTGRDLRAALESRGISQLRLAALTGCDPRTVRRWVDTRPATGDRQLPRPIQALIHITLTIYDQDHAIAPIAPAPNEEPVAPAPNGTSDTPDPTTPAASCDPASLPPDPIPNQNITKP